jgi:hypothetical protein
MGGKRVPPNLLRREPMDTTPPLLADAFQLLLTDLYEHLSEADFLATKTTAWSEKDVDSARRLIPDLILVIRGLLIAHQRTPSGDCRIRLSVWPCPVVTTIHGLVKDPDREFVAIVTRANDEGDGL